MVGAAEVGRPCALLPARAGWPCVLAPAAVGRIPAGSAYASGNVLVERSEPL